MKRILFLIATVLIGVAAMGQVTTINQNVYGSTVKDAMNTNFSNLQDSIDGVSTRGGIADTQLRDSLGWFIGESYGADPTGTADSYAALQAALTAAGAGGGIYLAPGTYKTSATLSLVSNQIFDLGGATITSTITDGTPTISIPRGAAEVVIKNGLIIGEGASQNTIGIKGGNFAWSDSSTWRVLIEEMEISLCDVGIELNAWESTLRDVLLKGNDTAYVGNFNNANLMDKVNFSNNTLDMLVDSSSGLTILQPTFQNSNGDSTLMSSRIDNGRNITILTPYFETSSAIVRDSAWLVIGERAIVSGLTITDFEQGSNNDFGVPQLKLDNVDRAYISGNFGLIWQTPVKTTSNSINIEIDVMPRAGGHLTDGGDNLGMAYNYFPNGGFEHWFGGWHSVTPSDVTFAVDTTHTKSGKNAIKVTGTNTTAAGFLLLRVDDNLEALWGKTITLGAWVYVPDSSFFPDDVSRLIKPTIKVNSYNGATTEGSVEYQYSVAGEWNYLRSTVTVHDDATRLYVYLYLNYSSAAITTDMWVTVDDMQIYNSTVPLQRAISTTFPDAPTIPAIVELGNLKQRRSATPTDTDQFYNVGDVIWNSAVSASGDLGWVCTTAGAGGTATWTAIDVVD